ncbi:MAG: transcriptional regulator CecR [Akkermansiaceae bacterium]|nr:transcriptional regulator CecR [Akkermansiaceae bacterium]
MNAELFAAAPTKGEQAKHRLLLAALEKIGEKGYDGASVREIAEAAGQNVAAIAYYFGNKESLYGEVIEGIIAYLNRTFGGLTQEAKRLFEGGGMTAAQGAELLKRMLRAFLTEHLERNEIGKLRNVMIREQASPTAAFGRLYSGGMEPLHEFFSRTLSAASGEDPESHQAIIRAHALFGQVLGFTVARSTILRRLGVPKLEKEHSDLIARVIDEHVDFICGGLCGKGGASCGGAGPSQ